MLLAEEKAKKWLESPLEESEKEAINNLLTSASSDDLQDAFYKDLEFGTGGLRGIMGIGSNRMNKYTIGMATQGLSNYLNQTFSGEEISVAIAHDCRNNSAFFADVTASVFSANGIKVYFFTELRPTPELSFAIRHLNCKSGVVITASHNPKEYNGYKAYWDDGAQVTPPHDENIIEEVRKIDSLEKVNFQKNADLIHLILEDIDEEYLKMLLTLTMSPAAIQNQSDISIVFSSIHGTGITLVPEALKRAGFNNISIVEEQSTPDGNFPTVVYPNPEESEAMSMAMAKAKEIGAELVMATDPDADRVGIAVKNDEGEFQILNGNQTGCLLFSYILTRWREEGKQKEGDYIVKTIVSSELMDEIARNNGVQCFNTLTGFKYIATIIRNLEGRQRFITGGEESYGYMIGDKVRDKDAVASCLLISEMAAWAKDRGLNLYGLLKQIYVENGFYLEDLITMTKKGMSGSEEIREIMKNLRDTPPKTINGSEVTRVLDYSTSKETVIATNSLKELEFPKSNVLQFYTADGSKISARPSGTEPKIKFYISVNDSMESISDFQNVKSKLLSRIEGIKSDLNLD